MSRIEHQQIQPLEIVLCVVIEPVKAFNIQTYRLMVQNLSTCPYMTHLEQV